MMRLIVCEGQSVEDAISQAVVADDDLPGFQRRIDRALSRFGMHNCARFRISFAQADEWERKKR
jgi:hypothetical protein